jgi:hypothetical protein
MHLVRVLALVADAEGAALGGASVGCGRAVPALQPFLPALLPAAAACLKNGKRHAGAVALRMDLTEAIAMIKAGTLDAQENPLAKTVTYGVHKFHKFHRNFRRILQKNLRRFCEILKMHFSSPKRSGSHPPPMAPSWTITAGP